MSRTFMVALVGVAFTASLAGGSALAAAPAEDQKLPVCVSVSVAGLDTDQLCNT